MDAVTKLNEHIDFLTLLNHYDFDKVRTEGKMIRSCCKLHGGSNPSAFVVNTENKLYYCHTGTCGGGDAYKLVQQLEGISFNEAVSKIASIFDVDIKDLDVIERRPEHIDEMKKWIKVMKERMKKKDIQEFHIKEEIKEVIKFRSFKEETLKHFSLGYVERAELSKKDGGTYTLFNRLVFPIYQDGKQIGLSFRRTKTKDFPKWSHQPVSIETKNILYNYDACIGKESVVVVEGIPDVWAYYEIGVDAVCTFGAHCTEEQYKLLMRTGADIILSYDGDEAGCNATSKVEKMFRNKANIYAVEFEEGEDPESIDRNQLKLKYESRKRI